ncbi:DUF5958 family protein [Flavobacterium daemonense]|uniref:DUF5958 family protein n=1 Tax=Flavobacterium daemonense TaxID=1393049 RepID=UPI001185A12E|nr:DUF5958 family protein [Flavobacterium daemonense]KAF2331902.1 hypothetical protein FND99_12735 [Flavobacterium daemonense]
MTKSEKLINKIAQNQLEFNSGVMLLLEGDYNFKALFTTLHNYIINSIPNKTNYDSDAYQTALNTIPLKSSSTPVVILKTYSTKIAFQKLALLPVDEEKKTITALLWIFKITDTERRNTECKRWL